MNRSDAVNELTEALAKAQGAIENATMDKSNPYFKSRYASLASVRDSIKKPLSEHGLSITQTIQMRLEGMVLVTTLWHSSGQWLSSDYPLPKDATPQELGSALTYGRRYSLAALICNSADEDDDGNAAQDASTFRRPRPPAPSPIGSRPQPVIQPDPHAIPVLPTDDGKGSNWIGWGEIFIASAQASKTPEIADQWLKLNQTPLQQMSNDVPKVFARLKSAVTGVYPKGVLLDGETSQERTPQSNDKDSGTKVVR